MNSSVNKNSIPNHIAIIMDGNGRWARERGQARSRGHREGAKRVDEIVTECRKLGVRFLTLYTFSSENWNRPSTEVILLMRLLVRYLKLMDKKLFKNRVKLVCQGNISKLPKSVQAELKRVMEFTSVPDTKMTLNLALSYGGREEIVESTRSIAAEIMGGKYSVSDIDEALFRKHLYQPEIPDPDLLIRTGGEFRVSNFLLWEVAYSEFYFTKAYWPDFTDSELHRALNEYMKRTRRFGLTDSQVKKSKSPFFGLSLQ